MKNFYVEDAPRFDNQKIVSFFVVAALQVRAKKTGEPFLQLTLADRTGQIEAKMWDNVESSLWQDGTKTKRKFDTGDCVKISGQVNQFNDRFQIIVGQIRPATDAEKDPTDMLPVSTRAVSEMWAELQQRVATVNDPHLRQLLESFLNDPALAEQLRLAPAAKLLHHAWIGGLLEHILSLMALAESVLPHYPHVNRDLVLTGVVLHDIGKLSELTYDSCFGYSLEGQMLGHIVIGLGMARDRMAAIPGFPPKLRMLVEHIIISHHGQYDFGSPKLPMTAEAVMLSMLDDLDAKMQLMQSEFRRQQSAGQDGAQMTDWVRAMERPLLDTSRYLAETGDETRSENVPPGGDDAIPAED
jgi:3'-5' exoribonuclease